MELPAEYAKHCTPFKQRSLGINDPAVEYGVCVGLSVDWITRHKNFKAEGAAKRINFIATQARASAILRQKAYLAILKATNSSASSGQTMELDAALAEFECGFSATMVSSNPYVWSDPKESLHPLYTNTSSYNTYYLIILSFGTDHHCIAAYHSSGKLFGYGSHLYVFEPNFGEIKIGGSETQVKAFFKALADEYENYTTKAGKRSPKRLDTITINKLTDAFAMPTRTRAA